MISIAYTVDGPDDAPVVLLGPSLGTTAELWRDVVPALAAHFRVVRYDHRGHGASPVPPGPYGIADLGSDLLLLLDRLGVERAHFAGISMAGMASMWAAANAPDRVDHLMLMCTSAQLGPPEAWALRAQTVQDKGMDAIADAVVARWVPPEFARSHPEVMAWLRGLLVSSPVDGYAACCAAIETMDLTPILGRITAPTLVVAGLADEATPPAHAQRIVAGIPNARLVLAAGAAHIPHVSRPDLIVDQLVSFLGGAM
jgi:3-oxoadipate enol-lactonase